MIFTKLHSARDPAQLDQVNTLRSLTSPIPMNRVSECVFTIAVGKPMYLEMAFALARSFKIWHRESDLRFFLATDASRTALPKDLQDLDIIPIRPGQFGVGFSPKLHLDKIAPGERSLFVDADCLCVGSLEPAFKLFQGNAVSVIGREISCGEWFGDVGEVCSMFYVHAIPRFNGGVYYLERGDLCSKVYETARMLEPRYDEIGFVRLRGHANDEVLLSLAMAIHQQKPVPEQGDIMNSLMAGPGGVEVDVFKGKAVLRNPKDHPLHNPWYDLDVHRPKLIHFLGSDISSYPYKQEAIRLRLVCEKGWPIWASTCWAILTFSSIWIVREIMKQMLRPIYRFFFGTRRIGTSSRS